MKHYKEGKIKIINPNNIPLGYYGKQAFDNFNESGKKAIIDSETNEPMKQSVMTWERTWGAKIDDVFIIEYQKSDGDTHIYEVK